MPALTDEDVAATARVGGTGLDRGEAERMVEAEQLCKWVKLPLFLTKPSSIEYVKEG